MDKSDVVLLLAFAGTYDYRKVGDADIEAWFLAVGDLDFQDAKQAIVAHYRNSAERMMPFHLRQGVKAIKDERRRVEKVAARELPSRYENDLGREMSAAQGAATAREVLAQVVGHLAAKNPGRQVTALDELRAITAGPDWSDADEENA